nr:unnamed protein product [Leishmania braziliensis]
MLYPNSAMLVVWCRPAYGVCVERHRASQLRQRQSRSVAGSAVSHALTDVPPPLPPAAWIEVPKGPWANYTAGATVEAVPCTPPTTSSWRGKPASRLACSERPPPTPTYEDELAAAPGG